jgi:hypothetical protein
VSTAHVHTWDYGAAAAHSSTWDDGKGAIVEELGAVYAKRGMRLTTFVIPVEIRADAACAHPQHCARCQGHPECDHWTASWDELRAAVQDGGHEVGSHTYSHPDLRKLATDAAAQHQIVDAAQLLADRMSAVSGADSVTSFAYPHGFGYDNAYIQRYVPSTYLGARLFGVMPRNDTRDDWGVELAEPRSLTQIRCIEYGDQREGAELWDRHLDEAVRTRGWYVGCGHGYKRSGYHPVVAAQMDTHLDNLQRKMASGAVWQATFGDALRYIRQRRAFDVSRVTMRDDGSVATVVLERTPGVKLMAFRRIPLAIGLRIATTFGATIGAPVVTSTVPAGIVASIAQYPDARKPGQPFDGAPIVAGCILHSAQLLLRVTPPAGDDVQRIEIHIALK